MRRAIDFAGRLLYTEGIAFGWARLRFGAQGKVSMEKRRSVVVAILMSMPLPGLGQLYCGRPLAAGIFGAAGFANWALFLALWVGWDADLDWSLGVWWATFSLVWLAALVHAGLIARRTREDYRLRPYNLWTFYLLLVALGWAGHYGFYRLVGAHCLTSVQLRSDVMTPGLLAGDLLRVDLRADSRRELARGTVVTAIDPLDGQTLRVLRVVGLPGENLAIGPEGVTIDSKPLARRDGQTGAYPRQNLQGDWVEQRYLQATEQIGTHHVSLALDLDPAKRRSGEFRVPAGHMFLLGDNRIHAQDSRAFGPLPVEAVEGVVLQVWFSRDPQSRKLRAERRGLPVP